jgi:hypothetical protein
LHRRNRSSLKTLIPARHSTGKTKPIVYPLALDRLTVKPCVLYQLPLANCTADRGAASFMSDVFLHVRSKKGPAFRRRTWAILWKWNSNLNSSGMTGRCQGLKFSSKARALAGSKRLLKLCLGYGQNFLQTFKQRVATNATREFFVRPRGRADRRPELQAQLSRTRFI